MSSYFRPDPFDVEFLRLAEPDRDVRRPELFFAKKIPPYHIMPPPSESGGIAKIIYPYVSILFCQPICNSLRLVQNALLIKGLEDTVLHENLAVDHNRIDR